MLDGLSDGVGLCALQTTDWDMSKVRRVNSRG